MDRESRNHYLDILLDRYSQYLLKDDYKSIIEDLCKTYNGSLWTKDHELSRNLFTALYEIIPECVNNVPIDDIVKLTEHNNTLETFKWLGKWSVIPNSALSWSTIKSVEIEDGVQEIGGLAFASSSLKSITIPNSVTSVGEQAFSNCYSLKTVIMSNNVERILPNTFSFSQLTEIILPNVIYIEPAAFWCCSYLKKIVLENPKADIPYTLKRKIKTQQVFSGCRFSELTIYARSEKVKEFCNIFNIKYVDLDKGIV